MARKFFWTVQSISFSYGPVSFTIAPDLVPVCNVRSILLPPCPPPSEEYNMVFVNADLITVCQLFYQSKLQIEIITFFYEVLTITSDMKCDIMCNMGGGGLCHYGLCDCDMGPLARIPHCA